MKGSFRNDEQEEFARLGEPSFDGKDLIAAIENLKPTALIGAVGRDPGCFNKAVVDAMVKVNGSERPCIMALSNPKTQAEITSTDCWKWSDGKAIYGSGTGMENVELGGKTFCPGQVNNVYIFPGVSMGAICCQARTIPERLFMVAAEAVANSLDAEDSKADTVSQIQQTNEDIASMEESRIAEHNAFQSAKSDDEQASQLLAAAIEAMSAFYKNNGIDTGAIQGGANALLQTGEPVFERSADQAPDASFSSAGKSGGESKGIISLMTMIKEDLDDEVSNGVKSEKKAQKEFEAQLGAAKKLVEDLTLKKTNLETGIADTNQEITDENVAKEGTEGLITDENVAKEGTE